MRGHVIYGLKSIETTVEPLQQKNWRHKYQPQRSRRSPRKVHLA
jgi:hypothetical protein